MAPAEPHPPAPPRAAAAPLRLLHFGDLHLWRLALDGDPFPKRLLGLANLLARRAKKFPPAVAEALAAQLAAEEADWLIFSGDLATTALRAEFEAGRALLRPVLEKWRGRVLAVPGNHDRYTPRATRARLYETLFLGEAARACPFSVDLDARWTLVGFDCCVPRLVSSRGHFTASQLAELARLLGAERARGRRLAVLGHYPLAYSAAQRPTWEHVLPEREAVHAELRRAGVELYLHGHKHYRWHVRAGGLAHLNCGSAGMLGSRPERRPGYLRVELGEEGLRGVEAVWLDAAPAGNASARWHSAPLRAEP